MASKKGEYGDFKPPPERMSIPEGRLQISPHKSMVPLESEPYNEIVPDFAVFQRKKGKWVETGHTIQSMASQQYTLDEINTTAKDRTGNMSGAYEGYTSPHGIRLTPPQIGSIYVDDDTTVDDIANKIVGVDSLKKTDLTSQSNENNLFYLLEHYNDQSKERDKYWSSCFLCYDSRDIKPKSQIEKELYDASNKELGGGYEADGVNLSEMSWEELVKQATIFNINVHKKRHPKHWYEKTLQEKREDAKRNVDERHKNEEKKRIMARKNPVRSKLI